MHRSSNNSHKQWHKQQLPSPTYNPHKRQDQHNQYSSSEDNQEAEEVNHNNLQPEDHQAVEGEEVVEEVAEVNQQPDNKLQDKLLQPHLVQSP